LNHAILINHLMLDAILLIQSLSVFAVGLMMIKILDYLALFLYIVNLALILQLHFDSNFVI